MSKKQQKKLEKEAAKQEARTLDNSKKVFMRFREHKYYHDLTVPIFSPGKIYEMEGRGWIERWMKRGGEIVDAKEVKGEDVEPGTQPVVPEDAPPIVPHQEVPQEPVTQENAQRELFMNGEDNED